ncbi:hypothetical protein GCM10009646_27100 [Streptomyces aureus]
MELKPALAAALGRAGSTRWRKATGEPVVFRPEAAQPFDDRCLSWQYDARTVPVDPGGAPQRTALHMAWYDNAKVDKALDAARRTDDRDRREGARDCWPWVTTGACWSAGAAGRWSGTRWAPPETADERGQGRPPPGSPPFTLSRQVNAACRSGQLPPRACPLTPTGPHTR